MTTHERITYYAFIVVIALGDAVASLILAGLIYLLIT